MLTFLQSVVLSPSFYILTQFFFQPQWIVLVLIFCHFSPWFQKIISRSVSSPWFIDLFLHNIIFIYQIVNIVLIRARKTGILSKKSIKFIIIIVFLLFIIIIIIVIIIIIIIIIIYRFFCDPSNFSWARFTVFTLDTQRFYKQSLVSVQLTSQSAERGTQFPQRSWEVWGLVSTKEKQQAMNSSRYWETGQNNRRGYSGPPRR